MKAVAVYSILWTLFLAALFVYAIFTIGCVDVGKETQVFVTDDYSKTAYYEEMTSRVHAFMVMENRETPVLPSRDELFARARFFEFASTPTTTCYFDPPDKIRIGDDKWASGCVPHELGHMALFMVGDSCWNDFEHPGGCK